MGFVVSSLTNYVDQTSTELLSVVHFGKQTAALSGLSVQAGVKSSAALQILTVDPIPQDGSSCGYNASGTTTFTQRNIATSAVKFEEDLCPRTLETKWTQLLLTPGQDYDENSIPAEILNQIVSKIQERLETSDWQGDTASGSAYLNRYDGLKKIIDNASGIQVATGSTSLAINATNIRTIMKNVKNAIPAALKGSSNVKVFVGYDTYEVYVDKLSTDNLFNVNVEGNAYEGLKVEGSMIDVIPLHGLDGTSSIYAADPSNFVLGMDMMDEEEDFRLWYSMDDDVVRYKVAFRRGWQIAHPSEVVQFIGA